MAELLEHIWGKGRRTTTQDVDELTKYENELSRRFTLYICHLFTLDLPAGFCIVVLGLIQHNVGVE